ncbi:MAG: hypothetical protein KDB25_02795 [Leucobacter sp.]|nr:hypothetical protein [Leucobacter sp.]
MNNVDVAAVMNGLKEFQRSAVNHVIDQFYGPGSDTRPGRFLIADETGLGKSLVARGVIAQTIKTLEHDDSVDRIDIVYVCSNSDLAAQNLKRLNVTGQEHVGMSTRLTLLAKESHKLATESEHEGKKVNLVSFTPGTSFSDGGWRQGNAWERAMLTVILDQLENRSESDRRTTRLMFHGAVNDWKRFDRHYVQAIKPHPSWEPDPRIVAEFAKLIRNTPSRYGEPGEQRRSLLEEFRYLREEMRGKRKPPSGAIWNEVHNLIDSLRHALAKAGVETLEPDLIILDEFQRFRQLLDPESGPAAELAHSLFDYGNAKVLLLSATPYKPFTNSGDSEDDHYQDFLATVRFLVGNDRAAEEEIARALSDYRTALLTGSETSATAANRASGLLRHVMTRSERPPITERTDLVEVRRLETQVPTVDDIREWSSLCSLSDITGASISLEQWKSIPYFANFMEGYQSADRVSQALEGENAGKTITALAQVRSLDPERVRALGEINLGNGHLRALADHTVGAGWWKLLWVPPSMPYLRPGPTYAAFQDGSMTKQVVFSAWTGVPTALAALLSHEATRRATTANSEAPGATEGDSDRADRSVGARLSYNVRDGRPASMSTLALFWPHFGLAKLSDQLAAAREAGGLVDPDAFVDAITDRLPDDVESAQAYEAFFASAEAFPDGLDGVDALQLIRESLSDGDTDVDQDRNTGAEEHVKAAIEIARTARDHRLTHKGLARLSAFSPGSLALRSLRTVAGPEVTTQGLWKAAFIVARGLRTLFNRPESAAILDTLYGTKVDYWLRVLDYCADGNLRAVLDEYLFQLRSDLGGKEIDDDALLELARTVEAAIALRPATYVAHDTTPQRESIRMPARFALRYGGKKATANAENNDAARQAVVRRSFNSPFAPFVLASTSVGQEGIDFHWWSHSVVHWNLPSNPVDFEQREGRVNRFAGHAVRKNVAAAHWSDVLSSNDPNAWRAAFDAAADPERMRPNDLGEFSPWWMYPGESRIHRVLSMYPFSRDITKYERLRNDLTLYRLTLGQPRQEDMIEMLAKRGVDAETLPTLDLSPPGASSE